MLSKAPVCRSFDFEVKDHVQLGASLGLMDFEAGAAVAGTKFAYLRGAGALLEVAGRGICNCCCQGHTSVCRFCCKAPQHANEPSAPSLAKSAGWLLTRSHTGAEEWRERRAILRVQVALVSWAMQRVAAAGFLPHGTPDLVRATVLEKCGFQPRGDNTQVCRGGVSSIQRAFSSCFGTPS